MTGPLVQSVVVDASAVLAWVLREKGWEAVDRLLPVAVAPASVMVEVLYRAGARGHGQDPAGLRADLLALGVRVEPLLDGDTLRAAALIAASRSDPGPGSLSLGDALCIATSERLGLPLTGGDRYWADLELAVPYLPFR